MVAVVAVVVVTSSLLGEGFRGVVGEEGLDPNEESVELLSSFALLSTFMTARMSSTEQGRLLLSLYDSLTFFRRG